MSLRKESVEEVVCKPLKQDGKFESQLSGDTKSKGDCFFLYFAAFVGSLSFFGSGTSIVWTSPVLPKLLSNDTNINPLGYPITSYDTSLIVGVFSVGNIITPFFSGKLTDTLGRKNTFLIMATINTIFVVVLAFSSEMLWILIARFVTGIYLGGTLTTLPVFISEITEDHNRGKFGCFMGLFLPLGQLYGYVMGLFFSVKYFTLMCAVPSLVHIVLLLVIPETPVHLVHTGRKEEAFKSLEKYRGDKKPNEIEKDLETIAHTLELTTKDHVGGLKSLVSHQPTRRGLFIGLGLFLIQMGSGIGVLTSFMGPIFEEANTGISGNMTAVLFGILKITIYFSVAHVIEKLGKKPLMFSSAILCTIALFFVGLYFFAKDKKIEGYQSFSWLPVASILFFVCVYSFGVGPIPLATIGELFASNVRSTACSTINFVGMVLNLITLTSFPIIVKYIGIYGCLWFFSATCILGAIFVYFVMPETRGKSIDEIQDILKGKSK